MKLIISESKNSASLYAAKSIYVNGKRTTKIVEKLGTVAELEKKLNGQDPIKWAKKYIEELTIKEKEETREVLVKYSPTKLINKGEQHCFNGGYLFLQQIYHELELHKLCKDISQKYKFKFDLDSILSRLIYGRILFPLSKLATFEESKKFIEQPNFDLHQIYRALGYLAKVTDFIQSSLYENSLKISKRNTGILFFDCTNFFFEIEEAKGKKQYGAGKEHKPNPIKDKEKIRAKVFYKERWIKENDLEQKLIVTYSVTYRDYLRNIRNSQIERAQKTIDENPETIKKCRQNDYKRFINKTNITTDGEIADVN